MSGTLGVLPWQSPLSGGDVIPGAKLFCYDSGGTTKRTMYTTSALAVQHSNPLVADANGRFAAFWVDPSGGEYKLVLASSGDTDPPASPLRTEDNIPAVPAAAVPFYDITLAELAAGITPTAYFYVPGDVRRYGAAGDGTTDDSAAIQRAVDVAEVGGGTVIFPSDHGYKWGMGSQVTISSLYPVNLIGDMTASPNATENASYIKPLNNISGSLFKYESPTASLNEGGGGKIRGLSFMDDSNISDVDLGDRRNYTMTAALNLDAFSLSSVQNTYFHYINGSAIRLGFVVMSNFENIWVRYSGDTGLPAIDHPNVANRAVQSSVFENIRAEVNFDEPYISIAATTGTRDNKFIANGFEASPTGAATGDGIEYFIDYAGDFSSFIGNHFSRNGATYAIRLSGDDNTVSATAGDDANWGGFAEITGNRNRVLGGSVAASQSTISTVLLGGQDNTIDGLTIYFGNRIYNTGSGNAVLNTNMFECTSLGTYLIEGTAAASKARYLNNTLRNANAQRAVTPSGISNAETAVMSGNVLTGNSAATGINVATANQIVTDNWLDGYTNEIVPNGHMADSIIERNVGFVTEYQGQVQITSGNTAVIQAHGLGFTPTLQMVRAAPLGDWGSATHWWVHSVDATNVEIRVDIAPGGSGLFFGVSIAPR